MKKKTKTKIMLTELADLQVRVSAIEDYIRCNEAAAKAFLDARAERTIQHKSIDDMLGNEPEARSDANHRD